jgi:hypothetical protein
MKNREEHKNIFGPGGCLSEHAIENLIKGALSETEKESVKRHALTCPLCADAIRGAEYFNSAAEFRKPLAQMKKSAFRKSLEQEPVSRNLFYTSVSIAASIILLIGIFYVYQSGIDLKKSGLLSEKKEISDLPKNLKANSPLSIEKTEAPESETEQLVAGDAKLKKLKSSGHENEINPFTEPIITDTANSAPAENKFLEKSAGEVPETEDLYSSKPAAENLSSPEQAKGTGLMPVSKQYAEDREEVSISRAAVKKDLAQASATEIVYSNEPKFQNGGLEDFKTYVTDSLIKIFPGLKLEIPVKVEFRVEASGKVTHAKIISGTDAKEVDSKILDIIKGSPVWVPAFRNEEAIGVDRQIELRLNQE